MKGERMVGTLRCSDLLGDLSDYLEGALPKERIDAIEEHLRGCDLCTRFGGEFGAMVRAIRHRLAEPGALPDDIAERLRKKLGI
ncbi:MAG: anti-sigma factor family protein [Thermoanaerobaculia bacterium]